MGADSGFRDDTWRPANYAAPVTTPEQREEIARRYAEGETAHSIALDMKLRAGTVRNYCRPRPKY